MDQEYEFEPMFGGGYQVRLQGEFVMYTEHDDPEKVDAHLAAHGWESRGQFLDSMIQARQAGF